MSKVNGSALRVDYRTQTVSRVAPPAKAAAAKLAPHNMVSGEIPAGSIALGAGEFGATVTLSIATLLEGRLMVQGASGAGKSWTLRRLLEQSARLIQQVVIDPEGEFVSLAETFGHLVVDASKLDAGALMELGGRVRAQRISIVLDVSELDRGGQMKSVTAFLQALVTAPREHWTGCLVAIDEAQLFAPFGVLDDVPPSVRKASIAAVADVMGRGRKRGLVGVIATLRLARLAKSAASDVHNFLVGKNTLDLDIKRAGEMIGWGARKASDRLPLLEAGWFVAVGAAFSSSPMVTKVGAVVSRHKGATPELSAAAVVDNAAVALGIEQLQAESAASAGEMDESRLQGGARAVRMFIRQAGFKCAGPVYDALKQLVPDGATVTSLCTHLALTSDEAAAAIALLKSYGVVELTDAGAVRIDHNFAKWRL